MWHTPCGDRVLVGAEAVLLKDAVDDMVGRIQDERAGYRWGGLYGIPLFDRLSWTQRLSLLDLVSTYLFTPTLTCLELTAVVEAAVGAIFTHIEMAVAGEEEFGDEPYWSDRVRAAYGEARDADQQAEANGTSVAANHVRASSLVHALCDDVLWDEDYLLQDLIVDAAPCDADVVKQAMGIDADYYAGIAPDVSDECADAVFERLKGLVGSTKTDPS